VTEILIKQPCISTLTEGAGKLENVKENEKARKWEAF